MLKVKVAESAGFCFGVKRAVNTCYETAGSAKGPVYTYGPIIHNEQVVEELKEKGVQVIADETQLETITEGTVIIRSHGVSEKVQEDILARGLQIVDATCPFVKKIHRIVREKSLKGADIVITGNRDHPEV